MRKLAIAVLLASVSAMSFAADAPGVSPGPGVRYATDAYPGFDNEGGIVNPTRKEPKWFSWWNGPKMSDSRAQFDYCRSLVREGRYAKAAKEYDALVREWPTSSEAPLAQQLLAELLYKKLDETIEAFAELKYLADFYSISCDYTEVVNTMYQVARMMREEGKTIVFFRFRNTVDVRRAFEACVLRAPGAKWAPEAMLAVGELRQDEGKLDEAVAVYENLRNRFYGTEASLKATRDEAEVRVKLVHQHGYNRERCRDTIEFLRMATRYCGGEDTEAISAMLSEVEGLVEADDFRAAEFYDSKMRTKRSAINAYEKFLREHPEGVYAEKAKARLEELKK